MQNRIFTSESVSSGHPDKVCDQISDAILDAYLSKDANAYVAVETLVKDNHCIIAGEVNSVATIDFETIVRTVIRDIGYIDPQLGFDADTCQITNLIGQQSPDIHSKVATNDDKPLGAGDQGMMFGFACNETAELMPTPILLAHNLLMQHQSLRQSGAIDWLLMDAKSQVTVAYDANYQVQSIDTIVLSTQHKKGIAQDQIEREVREQIINATVDNALIKPSTKLFINRNGIFEIGGPKGDCGLTGRKIIVDTYGGMARHGGGAFSGKDPSKVDRSAAYACRYVAKNIVGAGIADRCEIQVSYAIGIDAPMSIHVDTFDTISNPAIKESDIVDCINKNFDLTPQGIIDGLNLKRPIYQDTATYGHFGNSQYPWEQLDKVSAIKNYFTQ